MVHLEQIKESEQLLESVIAKWGKEVWNQNGHPPKTKEQRKVRHEVLVQLLIESKFTPESISLKFIDKILNITVPVNNGSLSSQQMKGAAYWYLVSAFANSNNVASKHPNVILLRPTKAA